MYISQRAIYHIVYSMYFHQHALSPPQDTVVYQRLAQGDNLKTTTEMHLNKFAEEGLRTLCVAQAIINEDMYQVRYMQLYRSVKYGLL